MSGSVMLAVVVFSGQLADGPGKWRVEMPRDARVDKLCAELEVARRRALERVASTLGLRPGPRPIEWRLVRPFPQQGKLREGFLAGHTEVREDRVIVRLPAHRYLARPAKARSVVLHEAAHAVLASRMPSAAAYALVPEWLREGLALRVSGEGPGRTAGRISAAVVEGQSPASFLRGTGSVAGVTQAEAWLALRTLEERVGGDGLIALSRALAAGRPAETALGAVLGKNAAQFPQHALRAARREIDRSAPKEHVASFRRGLRALQSKDLAVAASAFETVLERQETPLAESARYFLARTLLRAGEVDRGVECLRKLLEAEAEGLWEEECLEHLEKSARRSGRVDEAERCSRERRERFPSRGEPSPAR